MANELNPANEYDDLVKDDMRAGVRSSLYVAARQQPDGEAALQKLADRWGMPVETVRAKKPEIELHDRLESFDYETAIKENPKLSAWFSDPKNAGVSHDDFDTLSKTEKLLTHGRDYLGALGQGVIGQGAGSLLSGVSELLDVGARAIDRPVRSLFGDTVANAFWYEPARIGGMATDPFQALKDAGKVLKGAGNAIAPPQDRQTLGTDVTSGIGQLGFQIGSFFLTGGAATGAGMFAQGADIMADKTAKDKADPALRDTAILAGGAITMLTEKYGLDKILNRVPPEIKNRTLRFMADKVAAGGIEAGQEFAEGLLHDISRRVLTNKDAELLDGVDREMSAAALSAAIVRSAMGIKGHRNAQQTQQFFEALGEQSTDSKLRERMPERFKALMEKYTAGGPVENAFIPADKFAEYFQSQQIDPREAATEAGAKNFAEALASGGDVVIPMADFATHIAPTDHLQGLMQDLRLRQDELTSREAALAEANRDEADRQQESDIAAFNAAAKGEASLDKAIQRIVGDVEGQLVSRYDPNTARQMATVMRGMAVLATRANPNANPVEAAQALWDKYGLTVRANPLPDVLTKAPNFDAAIDPMLDRLRKGDLPTQLELNGASLVEWLREQGGVKDQGGELAARDAKLWDRENRKGGERRLVSEAGLDFDAARELATEFGFDVGKTEADFIAAIDREIGGSPLFAMGQGDDTKRRTADALDQLGKVLSEMGVDLSAMDNAAVKKLLMGGETEFAQSDSDKRASIRFGEDRRFQISLFEKANLSSFLHEAGHFYLEVMGDLAADPAADPQVKDDYAKILAFLGVTDRSQITTEHHEKFARANEAYLFEGNAPAPELRGVFQRFRAWLKVIYRELTRLNVELSDEVRGVFDRIYATDAEIEQASQQAQIEHLFLDADTAGMTEAEFGAYAATVAETTATAKEDLQTKLMRSEKLKREAWWREERKAVAEQVGAEFDALPAAQAFSAMVAGDSEFKLNRSQIVERYGQEITKRLARGYGDGKGAVYADEGIDIESAAELMGYPNADDLVSALVNLPNKKRYVAAETERVMAERHGDLLNDIALADEAMAALHNEKREQVLRIELRQMRKLWKAAEPALKLERAKQNEERRAAVDVARMAPPEQLRAMAAGIIGQKQIRDIAPNGYLQAERKASRAAFEAMAKRDIALAATMKQKELLNHYLYLEAGKALKDADKIRDYLAGFDTTKRRGELGKAGADYLEQIDAILDRYELRKVTGKAIDKRIALTAWLQEQEAMGNAVSVPQDIQDEARRVNWRQAPIDELRAVRDAVKNIAHLANLKNKLIRKGKLIDFQTVVGDLVGAVYSSGLKATPDLETVSKSSMTRREKAAALWRRFDAEHMKVEQLVEWLDGGKIDGPWAKYFFDLADDAQTQEYDMHAAVTTRIQELSESMPKAWKRRLSERSTVRLPGFRNPLLYKDLLSIAMNMGNAQNLQRLADGYRWGATELSAVRDALTGEDWRYVQGIWDAIETLWPKMAELEKRQSGLEPEKVQALEFEAAGETWRGGYFPLVYDPRKSNAGEKQANEAESVQSFMAKGYGRAATNKGATKTRVKELKAPVLLDYEQVITSHLSKVIKDISHREAVLGINRILSNADVKQALIERAGEARYQELNRWLQTLVSDRADTLHQASGLGRLAMMARTNMAIVSMGWKISTMMAQFAGFGNSLDVVKPQFLGKALIQSSSSPSSTWQMVQQKSGEMRNRANTIERDVRDSLLRMRGEGGLAADVRRTAFYFTAMADRIVSVPTWIGGYNQALAAGKTEEDAIRAGDRAVRLSQGAGGSKDMAAVQRNNELMKLITMYYTPFSVLYARLRDVGFKASTEGIGYLPHAAARLLALVVLPAVVGDLLAARGPDDDEDKVWWGIRKMLLYPLATIPVLRDFSAYFEAAIINASGEGKVKYAPDYKLSPIVSAIEKVAKLPEKIYAATQGERDLDQTAWDTFEASGYLFGLPTGQARITGEYLEDLLSGDAQPENAAEMMRDALFKRTK